MPTGPPISLATMPSVSVIGRPERRPRTISSIASGKFEVNFAMRRLIILPMTMCGRPMPMNRPTNRPKQERRALHHQPDHDDGGEAHRDHEIFAERDVLAGHLQPLAQERRLRDDRRRDAVHLAPRFANSFRICAWALAAMTSPWRSFTISMRRLRAFDVEGPLNAVSSQRRARLRRPGR